MKPSYIYTAIGLVVVIALLFGVNSFISNKSAIDEINNMEKTDLIDKGRPDITITAKHQYKDGMHIIAGETDMPTPCHILDWDTIVAESFPEQVTINFSLTTMADACTQVITPTRFKVEFTASEEASIVATLNGEEIVLNLIEANPDEDLDNFELFIKG